MKQLGIITFCTLLLLAGCSKSPLEILQSNKQYNNLNEAFWSNERINNTQLWAKAKIYCQQNSAKQNCAPVIDQILLSSESTTVPKYGSSGHYLTVPNF